VFRRTRLVPISLSGQRSDISVMVNSLSLLSAQAGINVRQAALHTSDYAKAARLEEGCNLVLTAQITGDTFQTLR